MVMSLPLPSDLCISAGSWYSDSATLLLAIGTFIEPGDIPGFGSRSRFDGVMSSLISVTAVISCNGIASIGTSSDIRAKYKNSLDTRIRRSCHVLIRITSDHDKNHVHVMIQIAPGMNYSNI